MSRGSRVRSPPGVRSACSVMVIIDASQALDPGSIPGRRIVLLRQRFSSFVLPSLCCGIFGPKIPVDSPKIPAVYAHVAQLGERQTEDLKVLGSIPSVGSVALVAQFGRAWV